MSSLSVFFALLSRDLFVLKRNIWRLFVDNAVLLFTNVVMFGFLLPAMGMSPQLIGPLFIGYTIFLMFEIGYNFSIALVHDIKFDRFINYQISLPILPRWLLCQYITKLVIEVSVVTLPILGFGILLLGDRFAIIKSNLFLFPIVYLLTIIFFAVLFLYLSFSSDYDWFTQNVWSRRLEPLFLFAALFIVWKKLYIFSKLFGIIFLLNPITYAAEGVRATLIGGDQFLPIWICISGLICSIIVMWFFLVHAMQKKLDYPQCVRQADE